MPEDRFTSGLATGVSTPSIGSPPGVPPGRLLNDQLRQSSTTRSEF